MTSWIIFGLLSALTAAVVAITGKIGVAGIHPTLATTIRTIVMAALLSLISFAFGLQKGVGALDWKAIISIIVAGIAGALSVLFYFYALRSGPASGVAALDRLSVVFVIVLAAFFLGETISWKAGIGAGLIVLGAILIVLK